MAQGINTNNLPLHIGIVDICCTVGSQQVSNQQLETTYELGTDYIYRRSGIETRSYKDQQTSYLEFALSSVRAVLLQNSVSVNEVAAVLCSSSKFDVHSPSLACRILNALDPDGSNESCAALDINAACTGYLYALQMAINQLVLQGPSAEQRYILVVTNEVFSSCLGHSPTSDFLFGDASSASLIEIAAAPKPNWKAEILQVNTGTIRDTKDAAGILTEEGSSKMYMNGLVVFENAVKAMSKSITDICLQNSIDITNIDKFVLHQANKKILDSVSRKLNLDDRFYANIQKYGNTGSTSIPLCLYEIFTSVAPLVDEQKVVLSAFGYGFTSGAALLTIK